MKTKHVGTVCTNTSAIGRQPVITAVVKIGQRNIRKERIRMAKDRETPCKYYICAGQCQKGREADHAHYCQKCDKYYPRARVRHLNQKKEKLNKLRKVGE